MMGVWDLPEETGNIDWQALGYQLVTGDSNTKNLGLLMIIMMLAISHTKFKPYFYLI
ncbi:hypothetical protein [Nostoc sp. 'Peltigera membranacea cyanobiont' 213]|uniref:hypothetical protein n=1 Tax=Nostoc sp. 'Peltigera membranacea cyanobiont' 213 TaxID=2014530 RepID=UPI00167CDC3C|nr:hypothetical protein [Nostoc sp. 'Peltigera membranacea cyanobiont' 213]